MGPTELCRLLFYFGRTRWGLRFSTRAALINWQASQVRRFLVTELLRVPFYRVFAGQPLH